MTSSLRQQRRRQDIRRRIAVQPGAPQCMVLDCGQATQAKAGEGLNRHYCQRHVEHYRRHGSYSKRSYTAAELAPWRSAALAWLRAHSELPEVRESAERVGTLYLRAGRPQDAYRLAGRSPEERAWNAWACLRLREIDPLAPLAVWIAVGLRHREDPQPERKIEYRWVQAGKALHRMAGGSHKHWEREMADGTIHRTSLHKHPASRGRVLRHLGESLAVAASPLEFTAFAALACVG